MQKNQSITLHRLENNRSIAVGFWDRSSPDIKDAYQPHRHDHYTCMLLETGELEVLLDFEHFVMPAKTLFISPPDQVHQVLNHSVASGWYISFENHLIEESMRARLDQSLAEIISVTLSEKEYGWFRSVIFSLLQLKDFNITPYREVEQPLLSAFIAQAGLCYQNKAENKSSNFASRPIIITKKFRNLVQYHFKTMKRPADYAKQLNISVSHLNDTVKKITGLSASSIIHKEILTEAQRLLYYTDVSIKEISYCLGYEDPKYFIKLFRKKTGYSPTEFRKQSNNTKDTNI
ncbi:AraC-type DNA-binding protein [Chryseobacterium arachidis]|uniref:AraC-type DNA-binding protein n=1 Tax=Chryseobacterium arachidis TaxID=1416778 RepID=A0A1M5FVI0_9FLAO|nr:helix-turn-helix transcriptional regulator [Chryseobacterium arachidis]SHF95459.1 AraC-type DNA-binding protein [Chryseobacterium arachidis]